MELSSQDYLLLLSDSEILRLHLLAKFRYRQGSSNNTHTILSILSYVEKEHTLPSSTIDRNSKMIRHLGISELEIWQQLLQLVLQV
ncbi:hypothetical protein H5410_009734 [Solanum commersonii]|uniref:Uncharacterized protein n=1 Tax=Solanum commersonii TaxID=4109 RepID=A0A9J6AJK9_SOLCO|nr:hypothetical protein H5410_009734 [Solanum commersonii]